MYLESGNFRLYLLFILCSCLLSIKIDPFVCGMQSVVRNGSHDDPLVLEFKNTHILERSECGFYIE